MPYSALFDWWIATISWSIAFPIVVSIYLYRHKKPRANEGRKFRLLRDFAFVWFLFALLAFYVVSVSLGSYFLFAIGNLAFEMLLVIYVLLASRPDQ